MHQKLLHGSVGTRPNTLFDTLAVRKEEHDCSVETCLSLSLSRSPYPSLNLSAPKELRSFLFEACSLRSAQQQHLLAMHTVCICDPCSKVVVAACVNFS